MDRLVYYFNYLDSLFIGYPIVIRITVFLVMTLSVIYFMSMIKILLFTYKNKRDNGRQKKIEKRFKDDLEHVLISANNMSYDEVKLILNPKEQRYKNWEKQQITYLILGLKKEKIFNNHNYTHLLSVFQLIPYWEGRLRKKDTMESMNALRRLDDIEESVIGSMFANKMNTRNDYLRKHIKSNYLKFAEHDAFKILDENFDSRFNTLDEIRIHDALSKRLKTKPLPNLFRWVATSNNAIYQCFLIHEIGIFNQKESAPHLLNLYKETENYDVRAQIAETLGILKYTEAIPVLAYDYDFTSTEVQDAIVAAMGNMGTSEAFSFLKHIYPLSLSNERQVHILHNMYRIDVKKTKTDLELKGASDFETVVLANLEQVNSVLA